MDYNDVHGLQQIFFSAAESMMKAQELPIAIAMWSALPEEKKREFAVAAFEAGLRSLRDSQPYEVARTIEKVVPIEAIAEERREDILNALRDRTVEFIGGAVLGDYSGPGKILRCLLDKTVEAAVTEEWLASRHDAIREAVERKLADAAIEVGASEYARELVRKACRKPGDGE